MEEKKAVEIVKKGREEKEGRDNRDNKGRMG